MPGPHYAFQATRGADGRIYAVGGYTGNGVSSSIDAYDTTSKAWATVASIPTPRYNSAATTGPDGLIYVLGGEDFSGNFVKVGSIVEAYDPATNSWRCSVGDTSPGCSSTSIAPLPDSNATFGKEAITGSDGRIYVFYAGVEAYNPSTNTWDCSASDTSSGCSSHNIPDMHFQHLMSGVTQGKDGRIYVFGGYDDQYGLIMDQVDAYDPSTNAWTVQASMPSAAYHVVAVTGMDGMIYVIGDGVVRAYEPALNTWVCATGASPCTSYNLAALPDTYSYYGKAGAAGSDGRIYMLGDDGITGRLVEAYLPPSTDTTPPVITPEISGTRGMNGWYTSDVTVTWSVTDPESPITSTSGCDATTLSGDTSGTTLTCSATSAGGTSSASVTIKRDATPPSCSVVMSPSSIWPPDHKMVPVKASVSVTDALSGAAGSLLAGLGSNEGDVHSETAGFVPGTAGDAGQVVAERNGNGLGRTYTFNYQANDAAGNTTLCNGTVRVPLDQGH